MSKELPVRKHPRLKGFDYSSNGAYYVTFCVKDRYEMLGQIVGRVALGAPIVELTDYGNIIYKEIDETYLYYSNIFVDKFIVMPNHVHMIIFVISENDQKDGAPRASRPTTAIIPSIVGVLKRKTNKVYGFKMWQDSYHDHIIRSESDYQRIWQYIDENPARWAEDDYFVKSTAH